MTIDISNNNPRVSYAVAQGATQTSFTVNFEFFENADLNVYVDGTKKSLTTHYTVSGGSGSTGTVTMSVTGATGGSTVVITRDTTIERTTDFSAGADINRAALNTQLDTLTAMVADIEDQASRAIQVSDYETAPSLELPSLDSRKGTVMGFNASTGAVEAGPKLADVSTLAAITADIATLADIEDGTDATDAIQTAASNSSNITTVAGISGNVTTVAGIASNVTSVAGNATNINTVAGDTADINALAGKTTELGLLGTSDAVSDMNTLGTSDVVSDMNTLGTSSNVTNMDTLAGISSNITTVAGVASNVTTVAGSISNVNTTASNISSVNTNATNISAIQGASGNASTATTKASEAATSATNAASSATSAATAQTAAEAARDSALAAFDSFDDRYLGAKSSAPSVDNDGNALVSGALYYDTTANAMQVYTGSAWVAAYASLSGALLVTNNLSDVNNAANSATNLGLGVGNTPTFNGVNTTGDISFGDSDKAKFGASNDLSIFHDGSNSYVSDQGTGQLVLLSNSFRLNNAANSENIITAEEDGAVSLFFNDSSKFQTSSSGIDVSGDILSSQVNFGSRTGTDRAYVGYTGNDAFLWNVDSGVLKFGTNDSEKMRLTSSGLLVGKTTIATGTAGIALRSNGEVRGTADGDYAARFSRLSSDGAIVGFEKDGAAVGSIGTHTQDSNTNFFIAYDRGSSDVGLGFGHSAGTGRAYYPCRDDGSGVSGAIDIGTSTYKYKDLYLSGTAYTGNLGVGTGTSSPVTALDVRGEISVGYDATYGLRFYNEDRNNWSSIGNPTATGDSSANLVFKVSSGEAMRLDSSGALGIGTGSTTLTRELTLKKNGQCDLAIIASTNQSAQLLFGDTDADNRGIIEYNNSSDYMGFTTAGAEDMRLTSGGDLHVDGNVIAYSTTISDERLKEDIKPIEGALDKVGQLSGYTFTYKADGKQSAGVIAQEVEAVLPSAVTESTLPLKTDDDVEYKTVQYDQLHGLLIEAIKELKAEIEELKNGASS